MNVDRIADFQQKWCSIESVETLNLQSQSVLDGFEPAKRPQHVEKCIDA